MRLRTLASALSLISFAAITPSCGGAASSTSTDHGAARVVEWAPSRGRECVRDGSGRVSCQGPRRVPLAQGDAAERAERLGLGTRPAVSRLLTQAPSETWLAEVHDEADHEGDDVALQWPVRDGRFFRGFGYVRAHLPSVRHDGLDIGGPVGTPILAAADGLVVYSDNGVRGYGNFLAILHADGTSTFYAHCRAIFVAAGEHVRRGEVVAEIGLTGITRGAHLHFELRDRGRPIDPMPRMRRARR